MSVIIKLSFWFSLLFSCRVTDPEIGNKIIDSIEQQESKGNIFVKNNGYCMGVMQIDRRYSPVPPILLRVPLINRVVGTRAIKYWKKRAKGDIRKALAAYNCGNAGLDKRCGMGYSIQVESRNTSFDRKHFNECSALQNFIDFSIDLKK
jgi:soluble lytic murein transglycosylase-like protein